MRILAFLAGFALGFIMAGLWRVPTPQAGQEYDPYAVPFGEVVTVGAT
jgi:hypothetical protein